MVGTIYCSLTCLCIAEEKHISQTHTESIEKKSYITKTPILSIFTEGKNFVYYIKTLQEKLAHHLLLKSNLCCVSPLQQMQEAQGHSVM